jgi:hypothetical protein
MFSRAATWITLGLWASSSVVTAVELSGHPKDMFDKSLSFLDTLYDDSVGYLYWFYFPLAAGQHETRSSVWYVPGLLQRNKGDDVEQAIRILKNVIGDQEKNVEAQWYGDYTVYPEQPTVNSSAYPPSVGSTILVPPDLHPAHQVYRFTILGILTGEVSLVPL